MKYSGETTYELQVAGLTRVLPVVQVSDGVWVASFVMLGDSELVNACAEELAHRLLAYDFDYLVGPEAKVLPLLHALATTLGQGRYIVCRKSVKAYMQNPLVVYARSITTSGKQTLVLDGMDAERIHGKRVAVVDDVVSTGGSLAAVEGLLSKAGAEIVCRAAVLKEGDSYGGNLVYLADLPIITQSPTASG
jgi:adenine phosphoribosyltransferase